jgi:HNH endonuclease
VIDKSPCEICHLSDLKVIHRHHIIPRYCALSTDKPDNLCCLCPTCHSLVHALEIVIEGWFFTSSGRRLFSHRKGENYVIRPGVILGPGLTVTIVDVK